MADRIIVDFQALDRISSQLNAAGRELDQALSQLARLRVTQDAGANVRIGGCGTSLRTIGMTVSAETVSAAVSSYKNAVENVSWYTSRLGTAVQNVSELFETIENSLSGKKLDAGETAPTSEGTQNEASSGSAWDSFLDFLKEAVGEMGILGTIASAVWSSSSKDSALRSLITYLSETGPAYAEWAKGLEELNGKDAWGSLVGLDKFLKTPATKGTKWSKMATNFKTGLKEGLSSGPAWISAAVSSIFSNYDEYAEGKITWDRAIFEGVAETAGTVALSAATAAGVAAIIPAAPVLAVGVISTAVIFAGDAVVSHFTGKGIVETAGTAVGDVYDWLKETYVSTKATVVNGWNAFSQAVSSVFSQSVPAAGVGAW